MLESFETVGEQLEEMKSLTLNEGDQKAFARAALTLKYEDSEPAPITERDLLTPRRFSDRASDMWTTFSRVQENLLKGGIRGRNKSGRSMTTRAVTGIDQNVKLNRALWVLGESKRFFTGHLITRYALSQDLDLRVELNRYDQNNEGILSFNYFF
ncbi:protein of unknown function [Nitrosospira multiformis]|uniref:Uncharacterized protein n=1 Tax=Nitrosospira multiformis TaxID=1231 RepID=A0A1H8MQC7_9PROT|nr:protein of unknown function [Nitrosospira multiformis]